MKPDVTAINTIIGFSRPTTYLAFGVVFNPSIVDCKLIVYEF